MKLVWATFAAIVFGINIFSSFPWVDIFVTGFIEKLNDLSLNYLDDVLYWGTSDTFSIIGAVVGGSEVNDLSTRSSH